MGAVLGLDCKIYRNTGNYASASWNEIGNVKDVTLTLEKAEADASTRGTSGWRARKGTLKDATIEFTMVWDTADADFTNIQQNFLNNGTVEFAVCDGAINTNNTQGLRTTCDIMTFTRNEPLEDVVTVNVTLKPSYGATTTWNTVTNSAF